MNKIQRMKKKVEKLAGIRVFDNCFPGNWPPIIRVRQIIAPAGFCAAPISVSER